MELDYHFEMGVKYEINLLKLSVNICFTKNSTNFDIIEGQLGYKKDELEKEIFAFGETYSFKKHPIQKIRSEAEQSKANLKQCTNEEFNEFKKLNIEYKKKFSFPFIIAVKGKNKNQILKYFRERIKNTLNEEFLEAKKQVKKIAIFRLEEILK